MRKKEIISLLNFLFDFIRTKKFVGKNLFYIFSYFSDVIQIIFFSFFINTLVS